MSSTVPECSQLGNDKDKLGPAVNNNYDNENTTAETKRRKPSAMTRRMSFSTTRPWSSYAENYSSCLSGLKRRNSSEQLFKRQSSLQSSPSSSSTDLSKSLDSRQLRNLKAPDSKADFKPVRSPKISAIHARPFHQRRWSSPVVFSVTKLASSVGQQTSKQLKEENDGSVDILQDSDEDKNADKICETDEIILSQEQGKTAVSMTEHCDEKTAEYKASEKSSNKNCNVNSSTAATFTTPQSVVDCAEKEVGKPSEAGKMDGNQMRCTKDESNSEALPGESMDAKLEDPNQNRNIYTEIKKNTKWSNSRSFRRRHHTIHADSRRFINQTLFTIAEQSSGSFAAGSVAASEANERARLKNGKLMSRRSKSLGDLSTLPNDVKTNGVSVQQLSAKSICVPLSRNKTKKVDETASRAATTVKYIGEETEENTSKKIASRPAVKVNIQSFNRIQITPGRSDEQQRPQGSKIQSYHISTQQHAVFTQPKAKWASITISQV